MNLVTQTPGLSHLAKLASGMSFERRIPRFAPYTFKEWFRRRPPQPDGTRSRVILWPDIFNNHFHPSTAIAAVHVLERAGCHVDVPEPPLCCGRPLYDYGTLDTAKRWLQDTVETLSHEIEAGVPIVGLEPSCVAVFRDEAMELLPDRQDVERLARQTFTLSEFLNSLGFRYARLDRRAILHGHCHHKAIMKLDAEEQAVKAMGIDLDVLDSGCFGMAGSFGFERDHYDVSMKVGERVLLPAVRSASKDTLVVADGFSCRTQIAQTTDRRALHLADVIEMAVCDGPRGPSGDYPEHKYVPDYAEGAPRMSTAATLIAGAAAASALAYMIARRWR